VLVVAGAGSGKTRVLTRRIAYLVSQRNVHPGSVLAITFTNKAAAEMRGRVTELVGNRAKLMWVSTFHSACVRILRAEIHRFNLTRTFSIYDDADSKRLMQLVAHDLSLDPKRFPVRAIMNWVSTCKNDLVDHESARSRVNTAIAEDYLAAYQEYQRRLAAANALDFDDLIMTTVHLMQAFPDLREQYRRRFRHVLVGRVPRHQSCPVRPRTRAVQRRCRRRSGR
jgi:DNA helicase-2/ATP-dependent DNA helicase PcrA